MFHSLRLTQDVNLVGITVQVIESFNLPLNHNINRDSFWPREWLTSSYFEAPEQPRQAANDPQTGGLWEPEGDYILRPAIDNAC